VEAMATGSAEQLQSFVDWCHQGPSRAHVTSVIETDKEEEKFTGFKIIRG
jgi:acylphosphatase